MKSLLTALLMVLAFNASATITDVVYLEKEISFTNRTAEKDWISYGRESEDGTVHCALYAHVPANTTYRVKSGGLALKKVGEVYYLLRGDLVLSISCSDPNKYPARTYVPSKELVEKTLPISNYPAASHTEVEF